MLFTHVLRMSLWFNFHFIRIDISTLGSCEYSLMGKCSCVDSRKSEKSKFIHKMLEKFTKRGQHSEQTNGYAQTHRQMNRLTHTQSHTHTFTLCSYAIKIRPFEGRSRIIYSSLYELPWAGRVLLCFFSLFPHSTIMNYFIHKDWMNEWISIDRNANEKITKICWRRTKKKRKKIKS